MPFVLSRLKSRVPRPRRRSRPGFTLLEVLLSVGIMASGVLSVVILYSMGFRETRQGREDIAAAAFADAVMAPLVNAASATNLTWSAFESGWSYETENGKQIASYPEGGWSAYYDSDSQIVSHPESTAQSAFSKALGRFSASGVSGSYPSKTEYGLSSGLVVTHEKNSGIVKIGFRATHNAEMLMSAPLYYTEVRFQGVADK